LAGHNLDVSCNYFAFQVVCSGQKIDADKFEKYALNTAELYISLYHWYFMPPTVHKMLIHGGEIIRRALVPIGWLSEEAQEARNKDYRYVKTIQNKIIKLFKMLS